MNVGLTAELLLATVAIFLFALALSSRVLSFPMAMTVSLIKVILPFLYFSFFFNKEWVLIDGVRYFLAGQNLLSEGYTPLSVFDEEALFYSMSAGGGQHILYDWYNLIAQWLFGESYASPVFMNVGTTFISALLLYRLAEQFRFPRAYCTGLFVFFLLHWELLSWSTVANLKDTVVLLLTIGTVYAAVRLAAERKLRHGLLLLFQLFLFYWLRFYVPLLMMVAIMIYMFIANSGRRRLYMVAMAVVVVGGYGAAMGVGEIMAGVGRLSLGTGMLAGTVKVMVIPRPWSLDIEYTFLLFAAILHWVFFIPAVAGAVLLWRSTPGYRPILIYLMVALLFYGAFEELQGARQRVQVLFVYAWAQYHFLWVLFQRLRRAALEAPGAAGAVGEPAA